MIVTINGPEKIGRLTDQRAERIHLMEGITSYVDQTPEQRQRAAAFDAPYEPVNLPDVPTEDMVVPGPRGDIPVRLYTPENLVEPDEHGLRPAFVWLHGGAFLFGDIDMPEGDHTAKRVAAATGIPVISVDYRLCVDGAHHPVCHDDCWAAYQWVRSSGHGIATDPQRVAIGGGSAGAALAGTVGVHGRDVGEAPSSLVLIYPVAHAPIPAPDDELRALLETLPPIFHLTEASNTRMMDNYLGEGGLPEENPGYALPGMAEDLSGLPPTYIENCEFDDLRASGEKFADQLRDAGVHVESHTIPGEMHGHLNAPGMATAIATCDHISTWLKATL
ncbi:MAG: alpha/beta hydrolase [Actinomycetaceae bacterium]|nr:alpha/beta hydrolase [Actinomycetaceae bacterium]